MKNYYLCFLFLLIVNFGYSQGTLDSAFHLLPNVYLNYNPPPGSVAQAGPDYGCTNGKRPVWFNFYVCGGDTDSTSAVWFNIGYSSFNSIGMIVWGPFDDTINIASKLTGANIDTCFEDVLPIPPFVGLRHLEFGKIYVGMFAVDSAASMYQISLLSEGYWTDNRCGLSNSRVANYKQDICMVTLDSSTQNNMIVWEKQNNYQIASFNIYREGVITNQFDSIGNVPISSTSAFVDNGVNPNQRSYRYIMSAVDSSGHTETNYNPNHDSALVHATIHVQASLGTMGEVNLSWNSYVGFAYSTFYIYRGTSANNLQILDSVSASTFAYSDYSPQTGLNYYKVTVHKSGGCSPDGGATVYLQAFSNPPYAMIVNIDESPSPGQILLGPNPFSDEILIKTAKEFNKCMVTIYDPLGQKIYEEPLNGSEKLIQHFFANGAYTLFVSGGGINYTKRIVKQ